VDDRVLGVSRQGGEGAIDPAARAFARRALRGSIRAVPIAGDASTKRFYRIRAAGKTAVLMITPDPFDSGSPFRTNHRILEAIGAPVPRLIARDDPSGLALLEDLGDATLQHHLLGADRSAWRRLYRQACDLIVLFQTRSRKVIRPDDFAARNALDRERFLFELDHFHRHFILGLRHLTPGPAEEALLRGFYADLAGECDRLARVYCHRDFMSRNLMVQGDRLRVIDYQDARMGPYTYDAASLLRDSSLDIDEELVEELTDYLADRLGEGPEEFRRDLRTVALERNIKELGTFGFMATERGKTAYLEYVPRAVRSIRRTLVTDRKYHFIYPVLDRYALSPAS
jgi:N-acetylmuramate 1-kinase